MKRFSVIQSLLVGLLIAVCLTGSVSTQASDSQLDEVVAAFEYRMQRVRNIRVNHEIETEVYDDDNGEIGGFISRIGPERYDYWQLDDSNRQDAALPNPDGSLTHYASNFDTARGQGVTRSGTAERPRGYIDSSRDPLMENNRYRFWLNIRDWGKGGSEYVFNYFLDHKETAEFGEELEDGLLKVTTDYKPFWNTATCEGKRILWLDPQRGFLPIRGFFEWKDRKDGLGRVERVDVLESSLVGDLWMPVHIKEHHIVTYSDDTSTHNIHTIRVLEIELGTVTPADLEIQFLPNTFFADAIKGIAYTGDEKGNPIGPVKQILSSTSALVPQDIGAVQVDQKGEAVQSRSIQWKWFVSVNAIIVASLGLIYCIKRFRSVRP